MNRLPKVCILMSSAALPFVRVMQICQVVTMVEWGIRGADVGRGELAGWEKEGLLRPTGAWRWFVDDMLADPNTMAAIEEKGITFDEFKVLCQKHADVSAFKASDSSLQHFTDQLVKTSSSLDLIMIVSYSRRIVNQAGDGHYSPVAAYHGGEDMALILDVAQHKYPFHWLPRKVLWEAMNELDGATREKRGLE
ncbi:hypothetical protein C3L33_18432, partial [Rhododendron williamsianum]